MYCKQERFLGGYSIFVWRESLAAYSETVVLLQLKAHQARWMVDLSPLGFSRFHSGFYMLLAQNHQTYIAFIGKGQRKNFLIHHLGWICFKPIWTGESSPLGKKQDASHKAQS